MTNDVNSCIASVLDKEFGYEVNMEEIKQELNVPCFFITLLDSSTKVIIGQRYEKQNQLCIQYFPESQQVQRECNNVAERLTLCLEYIPDQEGGLLRGVDMHYQVVDGILNFFVTYNIQVFKKEQPAEKMQNMTITTELGGESDE